MGGVSSRGRGSGLRGAALCGSGSGAQDGPRAAHTHCCSGELRCGYYGMAATVYEVYFGGGRDRLIVLRETENNLMQQNRERERWSERWSERERVSKRRRERKNETGKRQDGRQTGRQTDWAERQGIRWGRPTLRLAVDTGGHVNSKLWEGGEGERGRERERARAREREREREGERLTT